MTKLEKSTENSNIKQPEKESAKISSRDLLELIYWARRYCDGRSTYAPHTYNEVYRRVRSDNPELIRCGDKHDPTLMREGAFWPYAQDGMYDEIRGYYEARPWDAKQEETKKG